jgi:hypothetical protein
MARKLKALVEDTNPEVDEPVTDEVTEADEELEEAADSNPTAGLEGNHRTNIMSVAMHALNKMTNSELVDFFNKSIAGIGHEADPLPGGASKEHNQGSVKMHPSAASAVKESIAEDLKTIFGDDQTLTEEFRTKMETLFEAAVSARLSILEASLIEQYEEAFEAEMAETQEGVIDAIDAYMQHIVEDWMTTNEVAITSSLRTEITEEFIEGLKGLFSEHYIDVPEDKLDVLEMLTDRVGGLEEELNAALNANMELSEKVKNNEKYDAIADVSEGLTVVEAEKFRQLVEGLDYDEKFGDKLTTIKDHHFPKAKKPASTGLMTEEIVHDSDTDPEVKTVSPEMRRYMHALDRTSKRH